MTDTLHIPADKPTIDMPGNLPAKLLRHATVKPDEVAIRHKHLGVWREYTWEHYAERTITSALGLKTLGVQPGDRVAIHSDNRPAWCYVDLGAQAIGAVAVGIYPTCPVAEVEYLLSHCRAKVLVVEDEEQLDKAMAVWTRLPDLEAIVVIETRGVKVLGHPRIRTFDQFMEAGQQGNPDDIRAAVTAIEPDDVAIVIYTSGTTGPPKGAMITHGAIHFASQAYGEAFRLSADDEILSYLPLCHGAERIITVGSGIANGFIVNFGEGADAFNNDLRDVQPTFFLGVPRIWEKLLARVEIAMADASWLKRQTFKFWITRGERVAARRMKGCMTPVDHLVFFVGDLILYRPLRERLGLARARKSMSGAAPIAPQVLDFFWSIGVPVREVYAQTESLVATAIPVDDVRLGSVGVPFPGVDMKLADDGEILLRSPANFNGYLNAPETTAETLDADGWIHTGDVGEVDDDGFYYVTDRKKDIIITSGGKNISPSEIENALKVSPYIREAVVIGDRRKYLTALIGIEADTVGDWAARNRVSYTTYRDLSAKPETEQLISAVVDEVNQAFAQVETIKRFQLLTIELDHEDGQLTATQKVKRATVAEQFRDLIEEMYQ